MWSDASVVRSTAAHFFMTTPPPPPTSSDQMQAPVLSLPSDTKDDDDELREQSGSDVEETGIGRFADTEENRLNRLRKAREHVKPEEITKLEESIRTTKRFQIRSKTLLLTYKNCSDITAEDAKHYLVDRDDNNSFSRKPIRWLIGWQGPELWCYLEFDVAIRLSSRTKCDLHIANKDYPAHSIESAITKEGLEKKRAKLSGEITSNNFDRPSAENDRKRSWEELRDGYETADDFLTEVARVYPEQFFTNFDNIKNGANHYFGGQMARKRFAPSLPPAAR